MQTFLPYPHCARSAAVLDRQRLNRQRSEVKTILRALREPDAGYRHHPLTAMWRGHEALLCCYGIAICEEWRGRGYQDTLLPYFQAQLDAVMQQRGLLEGEQRPAWWGNKDFHLRHQSTLVRKDPAHYRQFFPDVPDHLPITYPAP